MAACPEHEDQILDSAVGALEPADEVRLAAHLSGCESCAGSLRATRKALEFAALAPPSEAELAALEGLEAGIRAGWRRAGARRDWLRRGAITLLAAAAALLLVLLPRSTPPIQDASTALATPDAIGAEVESWALSDPLADTLAEPTVAADALNQAPGDVALAEPQTAADLFLNPGE